MPRLNIKSILTVAVAVVIFLCALRIVGQVRLNEARIQQLNDTQSRGRISLSGTLLDPQVRYSGAQEKLSKAVTERERFYALNDAARSSFEIGKTEEADRYARELMTLKERYQDDWNCGNAIHGANVVLGRIALIENRVDDSKKHLIAAGNSPGSPQLNSFGPNMTLAKDLLENHETEIVLEYFELCRVFWEMHDEKLDSWSEAVKNGDVPEFGGNLLH